MKKIFCFMLAVILMVCFGVVPVFAEETETFVESGAESVTEGYETEAVSEIATVTETVADTKFAFLIETEEEQTRAVIWDKIKTELSKDAQFWALFVMGIVMIIVMVCMIFVQLGTTNPTQRKSMRGMAKAVDIVQNIRDTNSETLGKIYAENEEKMNKILELKEQLVEFNQLSAKEKRNFAMALAYDMRIHKLVCDRLAMPVSDKAIIDMWYAKGIDLIKEELDEEDIKRIDSLSSILDTVGTGV